MFDILAGLLLLTSVFAGLWRGAAYEVVRMLSFLVAVLISLYSLRVTGPVMGRMIDIAWMAAAVAVVGVFILVYAMLRLLGASLTRRLQENSTLSALDRGVGMGFGLLRAMVLLGLFNLLFHAAAGSGAGPAWVTQSALYPLTQASGKALRVFAPKAGALSADMSAAITSAVRQGATPTPDEGYSDGERRRLDVLVEKVR